MFARFFHVVHSFYCQMMFHHMDETYLIIHSSVDKPGYFCSLTIVYIAIMNPSVQVFLWIYIFIFLAFFFHKMECKAFTVFQWVEWLGCIVTGTAKLVSSVASPFYIPTIGIWGFQFLYILVNTCYYLTFWLSCPLHSSIWVRFCIFLMTNDITAFYVFTGHLCTFLGKCLIRFLTHFWLNHLSFYY